MPRILGNSGVRFVIVEGLSGLKVDGACFWLGGKLPVISMSLRHDRIDNFWFMLRHEIEHVLRGDAKKTEIPDVVVDAEESTLIIEEREQIANQAAAAFCVDPDEVDDCIKRFSPYFSKAAIERAARRIGVHPGLLVGQLHKRKNGLPYTHMRKLLVGVRSHVLDAAFVDGWDIVPQI